MKPLKNYGPFTIREPITFRKVVIYIGGFVLALVIGFVMHVLVYDVIRPNAERLYCDLTERCERNS